MKRIWAMGLTLALLCLTVPAAFSDVSPDAWYAAGVDAAAEAGLVQGYPDGAFGPEREVTRAEFVAMAARTVDGETAAGAGEYWCAATLRAAGQAGWLPPGWRDLPLDSAHFEVPITREEAAYVLLGVRSPGGDAADSPAALSDLDAVDPALRAAVVGAWSAGLVSGYPDGTFGPKDPLTRAQAAVLLSRTLPAADASPSGGDPSPSAGAGARPLHVEGTQLRDSEGNPVQLKGVSTHGLAWYPQYVNEDALRTLRDDWGANLVRLAMYTAEYGGYLNGGDQRELEAVIDRGVRAAEALGMYVIIDWHILSDGDPSAHTAEATAFFARMSERYKDCPNVLYELCNEPQNSPWQTVIKPYAETVLAAIRKNAPDAVVIVGTNTWSQDVDQVIGHRIDDPNVMYACHFYAATHRDFLRQRVSRALDAGLPIFISECGLCDASGGGGVDRDSARAWLELLDSRQVSYAAWSLCNKNETAALIRWDCPKLSGWTEDELTESGRLFRAAMRGD